MALRRRAASYGLPARKGRVQGSPGSRGDASALRTRAHRGRSRRAARALRGAALTLRDRPSRFREGHRRRSERCRRRHIADGPRHRRGPPKQRWHPRDRTTRTSRSSCDPGGPWRSLYSRRAAEREHRWLRQGAADRVDSEGEFIDRWPKGFFDERAEELF